jgi:hypothetical protein
LCSETHPLPRGGTDFISPNEDAATDGDLRVIDESGEDYLYPAEYFVMVDLPQAVEKSLLHAA